MPVRIENSDHSNQIKGGINPSKSCPKCQLEVSNSAGLMSCEQRIPHEPSFTRKRKVIEHDKKVTFVTDYTEHGSSTVEDNLAMLFRAGYRRVDSGYPTTYQMNYSWPLEYSQQLDAENKQNKNISIGGNHQQQDKIIPTCNHEHTPLESKNHIEVPVEAPLIKEGMRVKERKKQLVEPLPLPISERFRDVSYKQKEPLRTRGQVIDTNLAKLDVPNSAQHPTQKQSSETRQRELVTKQKRKKKRPYPSPLKRLYESDRQRLNLAKGLFETEYHRHYKDWLTKSWAGGDEKKDITYGSGPVLNDPTDPRLLKHSPPPPHDPPPRPLHYQTQYKSHFTEPSKFQYKEGAWKSSENEENAKAEDMEGVGVEEASSWFDQLVESRRKAEHYKWKSERTNFNPHHLLSLDQYEKDLLKENSSESNSMSSLSDTPFTKGSSVSDDDSIPCKEKEKPKSSKMHIFKPRKEMKSPTPPAPPTKGQSLIIEDIESDDPETTNASYLASMINKRKVDNMYKPFLRPASLKCTCDRQGSRKGVGSEGRVPTPELRQSSPTRIRHHLDSTTPCTGGILTSPPKNRQAASPTPQPVTYMSPVHQPHPPILSNPQAMSPAPQPRPPNLSNPRAMSPAPQPHPPNLSIPRAASQPHPPVSSKNHANSKNGAPRVSPSPPPKKKKPLYNRHHNEGKIKTPTKSDINGGPRRPVTTSPYHAHCAPRDPTQPSLQKLRPSLQNSHHRKLDFDSYILPKSTENASVGKLVRQHQSLVNPVRSNSARNTCKACLQSAKSPYDPLHFTSDDHARMRSTVPANYTSHLEAPHLRTPVESDLQSSQVESRKQLERIRERLKTDSRSQSPNCNGKRNYTSHMPTAYATTKFSGHAGVEDTRPSYRNLDVDQLSLSSMSMSSCSVASEILEKAKERRDRFWTSQTATP